jgi:MFS family permease
VTTLEPRQILRRFMVLRASRWFPTGLVLPVLVLYLVDRGLSLAQIGVAFAAQGVVVMLLELPTGGLSDALGRRRVLVVASIFEIVTLLVLVMATSVVWFAAAFAIQGIYRALESGPLDAWFVDAMNDAQPGYDIERGLGRGGVVLGVAIAVGSVLSGVLVSTHPLPVDPLVAPLLVALILRGIDTLLIASLMAETTPVLQRGVLAQEVSRVPSIIGGVLRLIRTSIPLALIVGVELLWGFGMGTFEGLFPPRLGEVLGSSERAAAIMGPVAAAAWAASAVGAAAAPWFSRRIGRHAAAAWMRILQGATVVMMALVTGPPGLITAYLVCYVIHGAANPVHFALLHDEAAAENRTTVLSLDSMVGQAGGAIGVIILGAVADAHGIPAGMYVGAVMLAAGAPLYVLAGRAHRRATPASLESL